MEQPEKSKPIPGFDGYSVTKNGRVWSSKTCRGVHGRWMKTHQQPTGHLTVMLQGQHGQRPYLVHRLVLLTWMGPCPEGMEALHGDGNPANNHLSNLRWGTRSENSLDAIRHGTCHTAKLDVQEVRAIRLALAEGEGVVAIAARYGLERHAISRIKSGETWGSVPDA